VPKGVVREEEHRREALAGVRRDAEALELVVLGEIESPLRGPAGNHEYLLHLVPA